MANLKKGRLPESDERETPPELFTKLNSRFRFTLDGAAAHDNAKLPRYNTKEAANFTWTGERVYLNPPYSDIAPWIVKAWSSEAELVYMLVPNWTDRKWWLDLVEPFRDGKSDEAPMHLSTEFMGRQRFLYKGLAIRTTDGKIGQPEFGLCGLIFERKQS